MPSKRTVQIVRAICDMDLEYLQKYTGLTDTRRSVSRKARASLKMLFTVAIAGAKHEDETKKLLDFDSKV